MNRLSRAVLLLALILSGYSSTSFASYFFFLKSGTQPNGAQVGTPVNLSSTGAGTLTLQANDLFSGSPALTFNIPASLQTSQVYMWKPGTDGQNECLDMGVNATGLIVSSLLDSTSQYSLTLTVVPNVNANCTDQNNSPPIRTASITGPTPTGTGPIVDWTGYYHLYNPLSQSSNSVPEPGILALLGLGLGALVLVKRRKATQK